jgi:hypothetical protein
LILAGFDGVGLICFDPNSSTDAKQEIRFNSIAPKLLKIFMAIIPQYAFI